MKSYIITLSHKNSYEWCMRAADLIQCCPCCWNSDSKAILWQYSFWGANTDQNIMLAFVLFVCFIHCRKEVLLQTELLLMVGCEGLVRTLNSCNILTGGQRAHFITITLMSKKCPVKQCSDGKKHISSDMSMSPAHPFILILVRSEEAWA